MRPTTIYSFGTIVATTTAFAQPNIHAVADLVARAVDPATMDPTKLSVFSVLKTAMPTGTGTDIVLPTGDVAPQWYKDLPADVMVLLAQMYPAAPTVVAAVSETASARGNVTESAAQETSNASRITLTSTLELIPTSTETLTGSARSDSTNGTLSTELPSPTQSALSTGAKNPAGSGKWPVAMGLSVAAIFWLFA